MSFASSRERDTKGRFIKPSAPSGFDRKAYCKEYNQKNRVKKIQYALDWGRNNKEKRKAARDRWRAKNKERTNFLTRRYNYRKQSARGSHSFEQIQDLYAAFPLCPYCNQNKPDTIDHIIPLSRGGTNDIENLFPVCMSCNSKKGAKTLIEWRPMLWLQFYSLTRKYA